MLCLLPSLTCSHRIASHIAFTPGDTVAGSLYSDKVVVASIPESILTTGRPACLPEKQQQVDCSWRLEKMGATAGKGKVL
jgi:hypothetical protein